MTCTLARKLQELKQIAGVYVPTYYQISLQQRLLGSITPGFPFLHGCHMEDRQMYRCSPYLHGTQ